VRLLLDTHAFLWANEAPERLGAHGELIADPANDRILSAVGGWEIAIKWALGRLQLPEPPSRYVPTRLDALAATSVPIEHAHALAVAELPQHHRDPFDRLLIAQAQLLDLPIVTADRIFTRYQVDVLLIE
jgi:PIN domain nuclease of toxin-antitoxin system